MTDGNGYTPLNEETVARLRAGTASLEDEIEKREHDLMIATDYGDEKQARLIEVDLERLRGLVPHQQLQISALEIPQELSVANQVKQILVEADGLEGDDRWLPVNSAILSIVMNLEARLYLVEDKLGLEHNAE
ncbi:hypothetical protein EDF51_106123 [Curtobacterium sp. PhB25]|uniref:hypothetical protein n=1 Tax=Curtobacterium sp. PhB25 TaxID=2485205 RepID=UPI0010670624|nr:hypothetical protein [Curtobacterium sp. PhB25]TDW69139.1 hypothetical protein EDF51_106123 [Curtobacterium sp. PhB25]